MVASRAGAMQRAALDYVGRGWSVVPLRPRDKYPLLKWEPYQYRVAAPEEVEGWFKRWPDANVGVVTGQTSGLVVLDIDPRHGGTDSLVAWETRTGGLPETVEAATGGGGRHLYFAAPPVFLRNRVGLASGIDLRANGGLVVAPPSVHPSGGRYAWRPGHGPADRPPAALPDWLARLAAGRGPRTGHAPNHWRRLVGDGVPEGTRNNSVASLAGHLLWHNVDPEVTRELLLCWNRVRCRPPLDDDEVSGVVSSILKRHQEEERDEDAEPSRRGVPR